jgi:hypothetical protein
VAAIGGHPRDAGCAANAAVVTNRTKPPAMSAAPVDQMTPSPTASGGPQITHALASSTAV